MNRKLLAIAVATALVPALQAHAALMLKLVSGATTINVTDGGAGDTDGLANNSIAYSGGVGDFSAAITLGTSNSPGSVASADLHIVSIEIANISTDPSKVDGLDLYLTATDYANPSGPLVLQNSFGSATVTNSTAGDVISFQSFADPGDVAFAQTVGTAAVTDISPGGSTSLPNGDTFATFTAGSLYSMTTHVSLSISSGAALVVPSATLSGSSQATSAIGNPNAPEPASLALLAVGGAALLRRRGHR